MNKNRIYRLVPYIGVGLLLLVSVVIVFAIKDFLDTPKKNKKMVQMISIVAPPPPPPPKLEKPPEPKMEEKVEIDEPKEAEPDMPDQLADDLPPAGDMLGLDADGAAGGDAFGLMARKGGRGLLAGLSAQSERNQYGSRMKSYFEECLYENETVRTDGYEVKIKVRLDGKGKIIQHELLGTSGDTAIDSALNNSIDKCRQLPEVPPENVNYISWRLVSRI